MLAGNFLSNHVNGLNFSKKLSKMFEYLREKIANNGILFLQEPHSSLTAQSSTSVTVLKVNCFFHMEPQILAVS